MSLSLRIRHNLILLLYLTSSVNISNILNINVAFKIQILRDVSRRFAERWTMDWVGKGRPPGGQREKWLTSEVGHSSVHSCLSLTGETFTEQWVLKKWTEEVLPVANHKWKLTLMLRIQKAGTGERLMLPVLKRKRSLLYSFVWCLS